MFRNEAPTLSVALDSLHRQRPAFSFEAIFVDGASDDGSVDVIRNHPLCASVPVTIVDLPPDNCGMGVAQNVGAELAEGEIILFMQADVRVLDPNGISAVADCFEDPSVVGTRYIGLGPQAVFRQYDFWGQVFNARYFGDRVAGAWDTKWNAVRRDVFESLGGFDDERLPLGGNDFEFETRLRRVGRIVTAPVEAEHLHGLGKPHRPSGLLKKYCRNSEVAGATAAIYFRNRDQVPGVWSRLLQQLAVPIVCAAALVPPAWPWSLITLFLLGVWHQRAAYRHVRSWRLVWLPFFSVAVLFAFSYYFLTGALRGKTHYEFDNRMR